MVGFSLQYELTYTNVLAMLDLGGLPIRAADRGEDAPLVLAGGPTATHPEPLAAFVDAFFIGEAEEKLPPLVLEAAELRRAGVPRRERLIRLAEGYPLYIPELYATEIDAESGFLVVGAPRRPARARPAAPRAGRGHQPLSVSRTTLRCRTPRRSSTAWPSRWRVAAPRGAGSARRA